MKLLPKTRREAFAERLMERWSLIAPIRSGGSGGGGGEEATFSKLEWASQVVWEYGNDYYPPKRFLFPPTESLFEYRVQGATSIKEIQHQIEPSILFCLRSCDTTAITYLDRFFLDGFEDSYYSARRRSTAIINLACTQPQEGCFCLSCDAGPALREGFDLQLTDLGQEYLMEVGSDLGQEMVELTRDLHTPSGEQYIKRAEGILTQAKDRFTLRPDMKKAVEAVSQGDISSVVEELAGSCFRCMGCTNLCPTCSCFDTHELCVEDNCYQRFRYWDSCQLAGFTREAGDKNPRPEASARLRRWYFHKLSPRYLKINGRIGCVGCGRCDRTCLGDLQMLTFLRGIGTL